MDSFTSKQNESAELSRDERINEIVRMVNESGRITTAIIQRKFNVGYSTAIRDLDALAEMKLVQRTHGGAIAVQNVNFTPPRKYTHRDITEVKPNYEAIAVKAVEMLEKNSLCYITSASVGYFMAKHMRKDIPLTLAVSSIVIAEELRELDNVEVRLIGGTMRKNGNCCDALACDTVRRMRFDACFITGAGISAGFGMSIQTPDSMAFIRAVMECSRKKSGCSPAKRWDLKPQISSRPRRC